jgi:hypothetical protein
MRRILDAAEKACILNFANMVCHIINIAHKVNDTAGV